MLSLIAFQNSSPDDDLAQIDVPSRSGPSFSVGKLRNVRIKVDSSVGKLAELPLLLELGGLLGVLQGQRPSVTKFWEIGGGSGHPLMRRPRAHEGVTYVIGIVSHDCGRGKDQETRLSML